MEAYLGAIEISGKSSTFRFGVNGSGKRMLRGNADRIRFRSCKKKAHQACSSDDTTHEIYILLV
jgi:hypothetical protein